jgi:hypothetical protein
MAVTTQTLAGFGFASVLGIAKEVTYNTAVTPAMYIPFADNAITPSNKFVPRMGVRKTKGQTLSGVGQLDLKASIEAECEPDSIGFLMAMAMGTDTATAASSGFYTHTMKLASPLDSFTLSADYTKNSVYAFTGMKMDTMNLSCKPSGFLTAKFGALGSTWVINTASSLTPTFGNLQPFEWEFISASTYNGTQLPFTDFNIDLKNNLKPEYSSTSGRFVRAINETAAQVTGSGTVPYENDVISNAVLAGVPIPIVVTFAHPVSGYSISFVMNNCLVESAPLDAKKNDVIQYAVKWSCFESTAGAQDDLQIILTNQTSTAYAP